MEYPKKTNAAFGLGVLDFDVMVGCNISSLSEIDRTKGEFSRIGWRRVV
jgi:hypothetical protein